MNLERFERERGSEWGELEGLVERARGRPERLGPAGLRRLGALYRAAAADLALARRRFAGEPVVRRLERAVAPARFLIYDTRSERPSLLAFVTRGYWQRVLERPGALLASALLLLAPALLAAAWALSDPAGASGLVPEQSANAVDPGPRGTDLGLSPAEEAAFSTQVLTNNVQVTFLAFAAGIVLALGTAAVLVYNGLIVGAIGGLTTEAGNGSFFVELVAAHGVLEISCIVVAGAAGLRMGWAIVEPGHRTRVDALVRESRRSVEIVLGTAPWLVLAGVIEGFVSRGGLAAEPALVIGVAAGGLYWGLVAWRGRGGHSRPRALAER